MDVVAEDVELIATAREVTRLWWVFLVTGIAWVLIAFMVLAFKPTTPATIGYLTGFVLIAAGVNEFMTIGMVDAWRWLHAVLGVLFVVAGIMALMSPFQTFGILALLIGWYLLFKGTFDIILSIMERDLVPLWGLALASGFGRARRRHTGTAAAANTANITSWICQDTATVNEINPTSSAASPSQNRKMPGAITSSAIRMKPKINQFQVPSDTNMSVMTRPL